MKDGYFERRCNLRFKKRSDTGLTLVFENHIDCRHELATLRTVTRWPRPDTGVRIEPVPTGFGRMVKFDVGL